MIYDGGLSPAEAERLARMPQPQPPRVEAPKGDEQPALFDDGFQEARCYFRRMFGEY